MKAIENGGVREKNLDGKKKEMRDSENGKG